METKEEWLSNEVKMEKEFKLSEKRRFRTINYKYPNNKITSGGKRTFIYPEEDVKEFIRLLKEEVNNARMYADMDEPDFWRTSIINQQQAEMRAKYLEEFLEFILKRAGEKLI